MADALDAISLLLAEVAHLRTAAAAAPRASNEAPHVRPDRDLTLRNLAVGMGELADAVRDARRHRAATPLASDTGALAASTTSSAGSKRFRGWGEHRARSTSPGTALAADGSGLSSPMSAGAALLSPSLLSPSNAAHSIASPWKAMSAAAVATMQHAALRKAYTEGLVARSSAAAAGAALRGEAAPGALLFAIVLPAAAAGSSAQLLAPSEELGGPLVIRLRRLVGPQAGPLASARASPLAGTLLDPPTGLHAGPLACPLADSSDGDATAHFAGSVDASGWDTEKATLPPPPSSSITQSGGLVHAAGVGQEGGGECGGTHAPSLVPSVTTTAQPPCASGGGDEFTAAWSGAADPGASLSIDGATFPSPSSGHPAPPSSTFLSVDDATARAAGASLTFLEGGGIRRYVALLEGAGYRLCVHPAERGTPINVIRALLQERKGSRNMPTVLRLLGIDIVRLDIARMPGYHGNTFEYSVTRAPLPLSPSVVA